MWNPRCGDQLLRSDLSDAQREQLSALLEDIYHGFLQDVAASRGKTPEEVRVEAASCGVAHASMDVTNRCHPKRPTTPCLAPRPCAFPLVPGMEASTLLQVPVACAAHLTAQPSLRAALLQVEDMLNAGIYKVDEFKQRGFLTDIMCVHSSCHNNGLCFCLLYCADPPSSVPVLAAFTCACLGNVKMRPVTCAVH